MQRYCVDCDLIQDKATGTCACGGLIETRDYGGAGSADINASFYEAFDDALPIDIGQLPRPLLRSRTVEAHYLASASKGQRVFLKFEADLPTGSTKDRAALVAIPYLMQAGASEIVLSSTGNTSTSFAYWANLFPDLLLHVFMGRDFLHRLQYTERQNVVVHVVDGDFVEAGRKAKEYASSTGAAWEGGYFNPGRRDGLKTVILEAIEDIGEVPRVYVQAVSSGMGLVGVMKAIDESHGDVDGVRCTPLAVQQASCAPMVSAWKRGNAVIGEDDKLRSPHGIAKAILRGDPSATYPSFHDVLVRHGGMLEAVSASEIRAAQEMIWENSHVAVCEASGAALAGYLNSRATAAVRSGESVLVNLTGSDRNEVDR